MKKKINATVVNNLPMNSEERRIAFAELCKQILARKTEAKKS